MRNFVERLGKLNTYTERMSEEDFLRREVSVLYGILSELYGADKLVLKAGKLEALKGMRSSNLPEQVLALQKLVYEDPTIDEVPTKDNLRETIEEIQDAVADLIAKRSVEERLEKKVAERMQQKHEDYIREVRLQIIKEDAGPENAQTLKRLAILEKKSQVRLAKSALEILRPSSLDEVVGQDTAISALVAKMAAPYPQHILLYGPPGVGKTTVARLALEAAKKTGRSAFENDAPFVEADGATLRWDPREVTNPLLGSVHDPIYQGARRDLAESGVPEPKTGLVTEAHGGVLFIDEIGELDLMLQNKLLKVLEDKRVVFDSSYYDPYDSNVPKYVKKLFDEGAPADFVLIGATTRDPEEISPAFRSRCAEIFFEPLTPADIITIIENAAKKLQVRLEEGVAELIADYTIEGRRATRILADAFGLAILRSDNGKASVITKDDILSVIQSSRLSPNALAHASKTPEVGKVFGVGVFGFLGSVLEIESVVFKAHEEGKGNLRFNETAGSMARDSVFNASSVIRKLIGKDLADYDVHINVIGGGNIDGPSAGLAITVAILSALEEEPVLQNVAVTGEISIQGKVKPVGGIYEKIYGAKQARMEKVIIPADNLKDIPGSLSGIEVIPVSTLEEAIPHLFERPERIIKR